MKKPTQIKIGFRWDDLSEEAKQSIEECDLVMDGSDPEYTEEMRLEEESLRKRIQQFNKVKSGRAN